MKRLSLISLFWLVAVVAAFFGGRASNEWKVKDEKEARRTLERSVLEDITFKFYSDEFAESLIQNIGEGIEFPTTADELQRIINLHQLTEVHLPTREQPYTSYALSPSYVLRVEACGEAPLDAQGGETVHNNAQNPANEWERSR